MAMLGFLKRDKVKDPFGGDDLFDGESRFAGKGPKIALAASVVMFLLLAGGITAVILTGKTPPPPVMGSLADADIEVVDDTGAPIAPTQPAAPAAGAPQQTTAATPQVAPDATAATDRSVERRPWLAAVTPADSRRLGVADATPPAKPGAKPAAAPPAPTPPKSEPAKPALMTPPPAAAPPAPVQTLTAANTVAKPPAAAAPPPAAKTPPAPAMPAKPADVAAKDAPKDAPKDTPKDTDVASADAFGPAPGAPSRFNLPANAETGPMVAGGRPRLVEPTAPPTDKTDISAPPPRFANLTEPKKDTGKTPVTGTAKVAVVIEGLGLNQSATDTAITKLPAAVTLAFSPYARDLKKWMDKAKASGHEVLIEVPMESKEFPAEDPGPMGLLTSLDQKQNGERLDTILKESGPAVGILDTEGSKFRESDPNIAAVFTKLKEHNLFYVQGQPGVRVGEASVPVAVADVVLDERPFRAAVDARLDYAERLAKYQGSAVASLGPKPVGFERLVLWLDQAQKKGVALAPISQVLIR